MRQQRAVIAALFLGVSAIAVQAEMLAAAAVPGAPKFDGQGEPVYVNRTDIHDLKRVRALCHCVIVMQNGRIVEEGPVDQVLENPSTNHTRRIVCAALEIAA